MKNDYIISENDVFIILRKKDGSELKTTIHIDDFHIANSMPNTWCAARDKRTRAIYVTGHVLIEGKRKSVSLHRLIMGSPLGKLVDHINGNALDNRRLNLRCVTKAQNNQNLRSNRKNNRSGFRGVHWHKADKRWVASVKINGIKEYLGNFKSVEEAAKVAMMRRSEVMPFANDVKSYEQQA